uniref:Uncharacterized protein n=1 Tax=Lactuca sativa TaxID=4236 RepID=A0A9R1VII6_LACSA|nr:hypothetical protein LSAT_V11C500252130 [Lactuca sativa]
MSFAAFGFYLIAKHAFQYIMERKRHWELKKRYLYQEVRCHNIKVQLAWKLVGQLKLDPRHTEAKEFIRSKAFGSYEYNPLLDSLEGNSGDSSDRTLSAAYTLESLKAAAYTLEVNGGIERSSVFYDECHKLYDIKFYAME